jgi:uncharacterized membrane protein YGL010W
MSQHWTTLYTAYAGFHRNPLNRALHVIGIPLILYAALVLLELVRFDGRPLHLGIVAAAVFVGWGGAFSWPRTLGLAAGLALMLCLPPLPPLAGTAWAAPLGLFVIGWALQFAGHAAEGVNPRFRQVPDFLVVGPLALVDALYRRLGLTRG